MGKKPETRLSIRATPDELKRWMRAAKAAREANQTGSGSRADWARLILNEAAKKQLGD